MKEKWKDIDGYSGLYQVSNLGRIKSLERLDKLTGIKVPEKILKTANRDKGSNYQRVGLSKDGKNKHFYVHRLVATAFIKNPNNYTDVNHLNEIKSDNRLENLEWCSRKYNINYGTHNIRVGDTKRNGYGSKPIIAMYSDGTYEEFPSLREASRILKIDSGSISKACRGIIKSHITHEIHFKYVDEI